MNRATITLAAMVLFITGAYVGSSVSLARQLIRQMEETQKYRLNYELLSDILDGKIRKRYTSPNIAIYQRPKPRELANEGAKDVHRSGKPQ